MNRQLIDIDTDAVKVKPGLRLRRDDGDLHTLEESIRKLGLLNPIVVDSNHVLISGFRRLNACRAVGVSPIPAWRLDVDANSMTAMSVRSDENLCRLPLATEELDGLIRAKKARLGETSTEKQGSVLGGFKRFFSGRS